MTETHVLLRKIVPELIEIFEKRYTILQTINSMQPIGRRSLASILGIGERSIRTETTFLREVGLIEVNPSGMKITREGEVILEGLKNFSHQLKGFSKLEQKIADLFHLDKVIIVPGNADEDKTSLMNIGKAAAALLKEIIKDGHTIAVTGGSTVGAVADALSYIGDLKNTLVIPARGGMGGSVEYQSNTIAATFAKKLGGNYKLLHVPGQLRAEIVETLMDEPGVRSVIESLKKTDILVYGIGKAEDMAIRRNLSRDQIEILKRREAVAEAFGYFFNKNGEIVFSSNCIGLNINDLQKIPRLIGVAGGKQKARVIMAVARHCPGGVLIIDEGAAHEILRLASKTD